MSQSFVQSVTNTFVKGLITEAGPLTFPKDASVDELNMVLNRDGSRRRRLGIEQETDWESTDYTVADANLVNVGVWYNVSGTGGINYAVVQNGAEISFFALNGSSVSTQRVPTSNSDTTPYVIDLSAYESPSSAGAETQYVDMTSLNGRLIIVSSAIEAISVERNSSTGVFTVTELALEERDFEWLGRASSDYELPISTGSIYPNRSYDTRNAGWRGTDTGAAARTTYVTAETAWPPLTHPWYSGKDSSGNFSVAEFKKIYTGNSLIANGSYIYSIFDKDRVTKSGVASVTNETISVRFSCVAGYAGRVFYSGLNTNRKGLGSRVYFSQLVTDNFEDIGKCYQRNDPTSEEFSDLLDTDGGFISIPEANTIKKLHVFGPTLYVFADNGVWAINGVDDVFRASEYSVSKLTEVGLRWKKSFVSAEGRPYWWSENAIHTLTLNDQIGTIVEQDISTPTIKTYWDRLTNEQKNVARGVYDGLNNRVMWMYQEAETSYEVRYDRFLIFDEVFSAFYPWRVAPETNNHIIGAVYDPQSVTTEENSSGLKFLLRLVPGNSATFGGFTQTTFVDFTDTNYESYAVAGYDFLGDMTIQKNAPYITVYMARTETGFTGNDMDGYAAVRESACFVSAAWDFESSFGRSQNAYRLKFPIVVNTMNLDNFDYPTTVIATRLKLRGRGRSMRVRFVADEGKDMHLYGFEIIGARNPTF